MAFKALFEVWKYNIITETEIRLKWKIDLLTNVKPKIINVSRETKSWDKGYKRF